MLPSELTNAIEQFITHVHRNEAHLTYICVYHTNIFEADNIDKNPSPKCHFPTTIIFSFAPGQGGVASAGCPPNKNPGYAGVLENRRFFVELGGKRSRWRSQRNGLPQGSVLAPLIFNVYTNNQPIHPGTRRFVYAYDIAVTSQSTDFATIDETLTSVLDRLSEYYTTNQFRANPTKTQVSLFHLRNCECGKQLNISWNGVNLTHCNLPVYLGVTLDRTLSYKAHIEKTKKKVGTRNNIIRKLRPSNGEPLQPHSGRLL